MRTIEELVSCVHEHGDEPNAFIEWLKTKEDVIVGQKGRSTDCPIHNFLVDSCPDLECSVSGSYVQVWNPNELSSSRDVYIGHWAGVFVSKFDMSDQRIIPYGATGKQALRVAIEAGIVPVSEVSVDFFS